VVSIPTSAGVSAAVAVVAGSSVVVSELAARAESAWAAGRPAGRVARRVAGRWPGRLVPRDRLAMT